MLKRRKQSNMMKLLGIGSLCLFLLGCSEESFSISNDTENHPFTEEIDGWEETEDKAEELREKEAVEEQENSEERDEKAVFVKEEMEIAVHICGAVNQPGVYIFKDKVRLYEGIQKAGGFREDAHKDYLNLATVLEDGMKIEVPTTEWLQEQEKKGMLETAGISFADSLSGRGNKTKEGGKLDLNTADEAALCTLPGIGVSKAKSIIAYREEHGGFEKAEDIMKISGIKESSYEKIKDLVTVSR